MMANVVQPKNAKMTVTPIPMNINGNPSFAKGNRLLMRVSLFMCDEPYRELTASCRCCYIYFGWACQRGLSAAGQTELGSYVRWSVISGDQGARIVNVAGIQTGKGQGAYG